MRCKRLNATVSVEFCKKRLLRLVHLTRSFRVINNIPMDHYAYRNIPVCLNCPKVKELLEGTIAEDETFIHLKEDAIKWLKEKESCSHMPLIPKD